MANLTEETKYPSGIYRWETTDPIIGGEPGFDSNGEPTGAGLDNVPTKQLADRTNYLKTAMDQLLNPAFAAIGGAFLRFESVPVTNMDTLITAGIYRTTTSTTNSPLSGTSDLVIVTVIGNSVRQHIFGSDMLTRTAVVSGGSTPTWGAWTNRGTPAGAVQSFARNTAPDGWLKANGAAVSRTTYARLFAAIGTTFGAGDGSTTFNLPDLRAEFVRGWDDGRGVDSGRAFGSAQADELKSHNHRIPTTLVAASAGTTTRVVGAEDQLQVTFNTGGSETRPRNVALLFCIKF